MPTYEYKRKDGTIFEIRQGINDEPLKTCPETGQPVQRMISGGGGVVYKGTGWYVTDYKQNGSRNGAGSSEQSGTGSNDETKAEGSPTSSSAADSSGSGKGTTGTKEDSGSSEASGSSNT